MNQWMIVTILLGLSARVVGTPPTGEIRIAFRPTAEVQTATIRLRDVAQIACADPKLAARLSDVDIGAAPAIGYTRSLSAAYARSCLRPLGIADARLQTAGPALIQITRASQTVPGSLLEQTACAAAEAAAPGSAAQIYSPLQDRLAPRGTLEVLATETRLAAGATACTVTMQIRVDRRIEACFPVSIRLRQRAQILVAARALVAGTLLTESDLRREERPVENGMTPLTDLAQALGRQLSVGVAAGAPIAQGILRVVPLVRRGARVKTICYGSGFTIACAGEALEDGAAGQTIRVRNVTSLKEFTARVLDAETLEVIY